MKIVAFIHHIMLDGEQTIPIYRRTFSRNVLIKTGQFPIRPTLERSLLAD
jgi:hypothetical protein